MVTYHCTEKVRKKLATRKPSLEVAETTKNFTNNGQPTNIRHVV